MIRVTVYAGPGGDRPASTTSRVVDSTQIHEELRQLGLEWKNADYFTTRQVVITLDPAPDEQDQTLVRARVRKAAELLEETGLL